MDEMNYPSEPVDGTIFANDKDGMIYEYRDGEWHNTGVTIAEYFSQDLTKGEDSPLHSGKSV